MGEGALPVWSIVIIEPLLLNPTLCAIDMRHAELSLPFESGVQTLGTVAGEAPLRLEHDWLIDEPSIAVQIPVDEFQLPPRLSVQSLLV
jgi:hypothetical protein